MSRIRSALRRRMARQLPREGGFTLVELVLACGIMAFVLASLAYTGTMAFADAALSRNRQTATGLANQALEQVRALPWNTLTLGLSTSDLQSGSDSAITASGGAYRYGGERIPNSATASTAPLSPHLATTTIDHVAYTVAVYVTYYNDLTTNNAYRVTARASWSSSLRAGTQKFVQTQTVMYADCSGSSTQAATHPYCAPVQPFLYGNSEISDGVITISAHDPSAGGISGVSFDEATMWLPTEASNMQIEQIRSVAAAVRTSGVTFTPTGGTASTLGKQVVVVGSDTDPGSSKPEYVSTSTPAQTSSSLSASGNGNSLVMTSSGGDTATATATVLSTATNACGNDANPSVDQLDSLPCGNGTTIQGGTMSAQMTLSGLGAATLASIANPSVGSAAHTNRDTAPQPSSCTATSADGCVRASHRASVGSVRIGGLPAALSAVAPAGFDYLIKLDNFTRTVTSEAGYGNANPNVTNGGTILYWNGLGYTSLEVASGTSASIPVTSITVTNGLTSTTLSIGGTVRTGGTTSGPCASPCPSAIAQAESPIVGDIRYTVVVAGTTVADLDIHIDLGTLLARAEYSPGA